MAFSLYKLLVLVISAVNAGSVLIWDKTFTPPIFEVSSKASMTFSPYPSVDTNRETGQETPLINHEAESSREVFRSESEVYCKQCNNQTNAYGNLTSFLSQLLNEQGTCEWKHVVLLSDTDIANVTDSVLDVILAQRKPMLHYSIYNNTSLSFIKNIFQYWYEKHRFINYIFLTKHALDILESVKEAFPRKSKYFLVSNLFKILVLFQKEDHAIRSKKWKGIHFDHVSVVTFSRPSFRVLDVYSLMWRANRTRELQVRGQELLSGKCSVFPNVKFGLNGLKLVCVIKKLEAAEDRVQQCRNKTTGELYYTGSELDVLRILEAKINFTVDFLSAENLTWDDVSELIASSQVDFGIPNWSLQSRMTHNLSTTMSTTFDTVEGFYIPTNTEASLRLRELKLMDTRTGCVVSLALGLSFVYFLIISIRAVFSRADPKESSDNIPDACSNVERPCTDKDTSGVCQKSRFRSMLLQWGFSLNSGALKNFQFSKSLTFFGKYISGLTEESHQHQLATSYETLTSFRLLRWSWLITFLLLTVIWTGFLTADKVETKPHKPVLTFERVILDNSFDWCISNNLSTYVQTLRTVRTGFLVNVKTSIDDHICKDYEKMKSKIKSGHFVGVAAGRLFQELKSESGLKNVETLEDRLQKFDKGIPMAIDSLLLDIFNSNIKWLLVSGIIRKLEKDRMEQRVACIEDALENGILTQHRKRERVLHTEDALEKDTLTQRIKEERVPCIDDEVEKNRSSQRRKRERVPHIRDILGKATLAQPHKGTQSPQIDEAVEKNRLKQRRKEQHAPCIDDAVGNNRLTQRRKRERVPHILDTLVKDRLTQQRKVEHGPHTENALEKNRLRQRHKRDRVPCITDARETVRISQHEHVQPTEDGFSGRRVTFEDMQNLLTCGAVATILATLVLLLELIVPVISSHRASKKYRVHADVHRDGQEDSSRFSDTDDDHDSPDSRRRF